VSLDVIAADVRKAEFPVGYLSGLVEIQRSWQAVRSGKEALVTPHKAHSASQQDLSGEQVLDD
jgi:hypothetical protein